MKFEWIINQHVMPNNEDIPVAKLYRILSNNKTDLVLNVYLMKYAYFTVLEPNYRFLNPSIIWLSSAEAHAKGTHANYCDLSVHEKTISKIEAATELIDKDIDQQLEKLKKLVP